MLVPATLVIRVFQALFMHRPFWNIYRYSPNLSHISINNATSNSYICMESKLLRTLFAEIARLPPTERSFAFPSMTPGDSRSSVSSFNPIRHKKSHCQLTLESDDSAPSGHMLIGKPINNVRRTRRMPLRSG